ncbi:MAG: hypothetical protein QXD53_06725 [Candidatus Bathyarchaeia archaeon]
MSDCYIIAAAINLQGQKRSFFKAEKEALNEIEELKKLLITFLTKQRVILRLHAKDA